MDPQAGGSFIPKAPLTSMPTRGSSVGLVFLIALLIFIASLVATGAVFLYKQYLNKTIASDSQSLTLAEGAYDPGSIQDLETLDSRINNAETLLKNHVAASGFFTFLSSQTKVNVYFTSLDYSVNPDGSANITLDGIADSFSTVALQSDQFGASQYLKNVVFSNIAVNQTGAVSFTVSAVVDPSVINYANVLGSSAAVPNTPSLTPTASSTPAATSTSQ